MDELFYKLRKKNNYNYFYIINLIYFILPFHKIKINIIKVIYSFYF